MYFQPSLSVVNKYEKLSMYILGCVNAALFNKAVQLCIYI